MRSLSSILIAIVALGLATYAMFRDETTTDTELDQQREQIQRNIDKIDSLERRNIQSLRTAAYRICSRDVLLRADVHMRARTMSRLRFLESRRGLPILDCEPNLRGLGARYLDPDQQRRFVRRYKHRRLTDSEYAICPQSVIGELGQAKNC